MRSGMLHKNLGKFINTALGLLTLDSYIRSRQQSNIERDLSKNYNETKLELTKLKEEGKATEEIKNKILGSFGRATESLQQSSFFCGKEKDIIAKLIETKLLKEKSLNDKTEINAVETDKLKSEISILEKDINYHTTTLEKGLNSTRKSLEEINDSTKDLAIGSDLIENYKTYLSTLTVEQMGALSLIISSQLIISATISIVLILYGNYLIKRFKLETRYPKLAKFIELRQKFVNYYIIMNLF